MSRGWPIHTSAAAGPRDWATAQVQYAMSSGTANVRLGVSKFFMCLRTVIARQKIEGRNPRLCRVGLRLLPLLGRRESLHQRGGHVAGALEQVDRQPVVLGQLRPQ